MALTRPTTDQVRFFSELTGEHILDSYLEAAEKGGRTLADLMDDIFTPAGDLKGGFEIRYNEVTHKLQSRFGIYADPEEAWVDVESLTLFNNVGTYQASTAYKALDVVQYTNGVLICRASHTSAATPDFSKWDWLIRPEQFDQILTDANAAKTAAQASQTAAAASASTATAQATTATTQATTANTHRVAAEAAKSAAEIARDQAQTAAATATAQATTATTRATEAATSANAAENARFNTETLQAQAQVYRDEARTARDEAASYAGAVTGVFVEGGYVDLSSGSYPAAPLSATIWQVIVGGTVTDVGPAYPHDTAGTLTVTPVIIGVSA